MVLVVLFLAFSLNPRLALWVAAGIPFSFAGMFMLGAVYGLSINVVSLLAMILVVASLSMTASSLPRASTSGLKKAKNLSRLP